MTSLERHEDRARLVDTREVLSARLVRLRMEHDEATTAQRKRRQFYLASHTERREMALGQRLEELQSALSAAHHERDELRQQLHESQKGKELELEQVRIAALSAQTLEHVASRGAADLLERTLASDELARVRRLLAETEASNQRLLDAQAAMAQRHRREVASLEQEARARERGLLEQLAAARAEAQQARASVDEAKREARAALRLMEADCGRLLEEVETKVAAHCPNCGRDRRGAAVAAAAQPQRPGAAAAAGVAADR